MSSSVSATTRQPRFRTSSSRPLSTSDIMASRTGLLDTSSWLASLFAEYSSPGRISPLTRARRISVSVEALRVAGCDRVPDGNCGTQGLFSEVICIGFSLWACDRCGNFYVIVKVSLGGVHPGSPLCARELPRYAADYCQRLLALASASGNCFVRGSCKTRVVGKSG